MLNDIITLLRQRFEAIRDERRTSANTATRIGDAFLSLLSFLENAVGSFLRKDQDDETNFFVTFLRGVFFGHYTPGALGTGGAVTVDENGNSSAEFDFLTIRKAAAFRSITILELKHIGGELGITAGAMKVSRVEEMDDAYRCYFDTTDGKRQVYQEFVVGDQARCQAFRLSQAGDGMLTTKYYWRLVVGVGDDYVDLSKSVADTGSGIPEEGDEVIQLGYRGDDHPERQSAIILSAVASDAPSQKFYQGIDSFNLADRFVKDEGFDPRTGLFHCDIYGNFFVGDKGTSPKNFIRYTKDGLEISGRVSIQVGSTLPDGTDIEAVVDKTALENAISDLKDDIGGLNGDIGKLENDVVNIGNDIDGLTGDVDKLGSGLDSLTDDVNNLTTGNENLLRNSGFTGDYIDEDVTAATAVDAGTPMYSDPLAHWEAENAEVITSAASVTGKAVNISGGSLRQTLEKTVEAGKNYIFSFRGSGSQITFSVGGYTKIITLTSALTRYNVKFQATESGVTFSISNATGKFMELQLVEGVVPNTDWINSPRDNDEALAYYQNLTYLANAIVNASTQVLGGLVLSQLFKVGNYRNGKMTEETGGMSGLYNSPSSPFLWGGGSMEKAFYTIAKYAENPLYQATADEVKNLMAQFVVTHGGRAILNDVIARGIVIATGGIFKNILTPNGNFHIDEQGNMSCRDAKIGGNMYAPLLSITPNNIEQYSTTDSHGNYMLNLDVTGLNVKFEGFSTNNVTIQLPLNESKFNGAIARIYNNSIVNLWITGTMNVQADAVGTKFHLKTWLTHHVNIEPNSYQSFQCQHFPQYTYIERLQESKTIAHESSMQTIASNLSFGDVVELSCGIIEGDGWYRVMAGSKTLIDTTSAQMPSDRMAGRVVQHKVVPNQNEITADVAEGSKLWVEVYVKNQNETYAWKQFSESIPQGGAKDLLGSWRMSGVHGVSVGFNPYITSEGYLRFSSWTRPDDNGVIHYNN